MTGRASKNFFVEPDAYEPYEMPFELASSFTSLKGVTAFSIVRNAARFAVYELMRISVKNHQTQPTRRVASARGLMSEPAHTRG